MPRASLGPMLGLSPEGAAMVDAFYQLTPHGMLNTAAQALLNSPAQVGQAPYVNIGPNGMPEIVPVTAKAAVPAQGASLLNTFLQSLAGE